MKDNVLIDFIDQLLTEDIEDEKFKHYIDVFSRFLGYTNSNYKYNGTYLSQYVEDFISTSQWIKRKNEKYAEILMEIAGLDYDFVLLLDHVYYAHSLTKEKDESRFGENKIYYVGIDKDRIVNKKIEVKVTIIRNDKEYTICKEYVDFEDKDLVKDISNNIKRTIDLKEREKI